MKVHLFQRDDDTGPDHKGRYRCVCTLPAENKAHQVPEVPPEVKAAEARRIGEGE
jgi:hypothetical protein